MDIDFIYKIHLHISYEPLKTNILIIPSWLRAGWVEWVEQLFQDERNKDKKPRGDPAANEQRDSLLKPRRHWLLPRCELRPWLNWVITKTISVDCVMGDWTAWSSCSKTCNDQGSRIRSREIIQARRNGGRPCPSEPVEKYDCNKEHCPSRCRVTNALWV